jgi:hypothetical protein
LAAKCCGPNELEIMASELLQRNQLILAMAAGSWAVRADSIARLGAPPNRPAGITAFRTQTLLKSRRSSFSEAGSVCKERTNEDGR